MYIYIMSYFNWSSEKNEKLLRERNIGFEDIIVAIDNDKILDVVKHPNQERYANQNMFVINVDGYAFLVPFVERENEIFLKSIFASRKATRKYLGGNNV